MRCCVHVVSSPADGARRLLLSSFLFLFAFWPPELRVRECREIMSTFPLDERQGPPARSDRQNAGPTAAQQNPADGTGVQPTAITTSKENFAATIGVSQSSAIQDMNSAARPDEFNSTPTPTTVAIFTGSSVPTPPSVAAGTSNNSGSGGSKGLSNGAVAGVAIGA